MVSSRSLVIALMRLHSVRELGIRLPAAARIPATRVAALARFAGAAKVSAILRLPNPRRLLRLPPHRRRPRNPRRGREAEGRRWHTTDTPRSREQSIVWSLTLGTRG